MAHRPPTRATGTRRSAYLRWLTAARFLASWPKEVETRIAAQDFQFSPSSLTVPSGKSTITVTNEGEVEHSFTLDDDSVSEDVEPGESVSVTVDITEDAGFHCEYHPDQMTGTLAVS
jgi:plastocyanin